MLLLFVALLAGAQTADETGIISGTVLVTGVDKPLGDVVVTIRGLTLGTTTDAGGRYILRLVPPGDHILVFSRRGYQRGTVADVRVAIGQTTTADAKLKPEYYEMDLFEIIAEPYEEQSVALLDERKNSAIMQDSLGSEFLTRLGAGDAAEAASKATGVSIVGGKFAVIRGLSDRYTGTTLNGGEVPTADPYRRSAQLDLFPTSMIEEIVVTKTFTPDQPGAFTAGAVNIVTKRFPEQFQFSLSAGLNYNTQGSFNNNFLSYPGGSTDWLARDDGTRALPSIVANTPPGAISGVGNNGRFNPTEAAFREQINLAFPTLEMSPLSSQSYIGHKFGISLGDSFKVLNRRVGYFMGLSYDSDYDHYEGGQTYRYETQRNRAGQTILVPTLLLDDTRSSQEISWSAVGSLSVELLEGHDVTATYIFNQTAEDVARSQIGPFRPLENDDPTFDLVSENLHWTQRNLETIQFIGDHDFPYMANFHLDWLASFTSTSQLEPDLRFFPYFINTFSDGSVEYATRDLNLDPSQPSRYYRTSEELNKNFKLDGTLPFNQWSDLEAKLKAGAYYSQADRTYRERAFGYRSVFDQYQPFRNDGDADAFLTTELLTGTPSGNLVAFQRYIQDLGTTFNYDGQSVISAAYGMVDLPLLPQLRLVGGARAEATELNVVTSILATGQRVTSSLDQVDILPAASLIWEVATNMNLRLAYSQTIARPTFREIAAIQTFDFVGGDFLRGNPDLVISQIRNYDIRWEWFRRPGEVLAASFFYKQIENPIELAQVGFGPSQFQYINSPEAELFGFELEARTALDVVDDLLQNFSVGGNFSYIQSEVPRSPRELQQRERFRVPGDSTRTLYDQSPYIINADFTYDSPRLGTTASIVFNVAGPRLVLAGFSLPDVIEDPAPRLDFILSQRLGKHWRLRFSARNLLNPEIRRFHDFANPDGGPEYVFSSFTRGREFGLSLTFDY